MQLSSSPTAGQPSNQPECLRERNRDCGIFVDARLLITYASIHWNSVSLGVGGDGGGGGGRGFYCVNTDQDDILYPLYVLQGVLPVVVVEASAVSIAGETY